MSCDLSHIYIIYTSNDIINKQGFFSELIRNYIIFVNELAPILLDDNS